MHTFNNNFYLTQTYKFDKNVKTKILNIFAYFLIKKKHFILRKQSYIVFNKINFEIIYI